MHEDQLLTHVSVHTRPTLYYYLVFVAKKNNLTMRELAKKIGMGYQSIMAIKTRRPSLETYEKIAAATHSSVDELLELEIEL